MASRLLRRGQVIPIGGIRGILRLDADPLLEKPLAVADAPVKAARQPETSHIDLEEAHRGLVLSRWVGRDDGIDIHAGNALFHAVFTRLDRNGRLVFISRDNGRFEGARSLGLDEGCILWNGMRRDFSGFTVFIIRPRLPVVDRTTKIELTAYFERFLVVG
jgi:hypothetical protein